MFCTKCSAEMLDDDIFCPKCGAPRKIKNINDYDDDIHKNVAASVDITPDEPDTDISGYNGSSSIEQQYSGYYESLENTKKKKAGGCFAKTLLTLFFALIIIIVLFSGFLLLNGESPIDYAKALYENAASLFDTSETDIVSVTDETSKTKLTLTTTTTTITTTTTTTNTTTMTSSTSNTTTKTTTTTTRPTTTTTKINIGQQVRDTSVGSWKADISALGLSVLGSKIKTINIKIDQTGHADVDFKVGFVKVKTTGSFTVADDGKTNLTIKVPYTDEIIKVVGYTKVANKNQIIFRCSEGDITLNRK